MTLTYGRNSANDEVHERTVSLTYRDIKNWFKLLRRHGYPCRYIVCGEYGSKKQRAHWHAIVFWQNGAPPLVGWKHNGEWVGKATTRTYFNHVRVDEHKNPVYLQDGTPAYYWPWGHVQIKEVPQDTVRYVCKYLYKDNSDPKNQSVARMSRMPGLGQRYFVQLAQKMMEANIVPHDLTYRFKEVVTRGLDGRIKPVDFIMTGSSAHHFLEECLRLRNEQPDRNWRRSELLDNFEAHGKVVLNEWAHLEAKDGQVYPAVEKLPSSEWFKERVPQVIKQAASIKAERKYKRWVEWFSLYVMAASNGKEREFRTEEFKRYVIQNKPGIDRETSEFIAACDFERLYELGWIDDEYLRNRAATRAALERREQQREARKRAAAADRTAEGGHTG